MNERSDLLGLVATWYYLDGVGLTEIARRIDRSVSMVSRLLQEARDSKIVEIRVRHQMASDSRLEAELCTRFGLSRAIVLRVDTYEAQTFADRFVQFGRRAAGAIEALLKPGQVIGIGWGEHVHAVVNGMPQLDLGAGKVVQCSGTIGGTVPSVDGGRLTYLFASKLGFDAQPLYAPLIVESEALALELRQSPAISSTVELARHSDLLLAGIGNPYNYSSGLRKSGYLTAADLESLRANDLVGDILGYHLTRDGRVSDVSVNRRTIGLELEALSRIPLVVGIASGIDKVPAIKAVLAGEYLDIFITDIPTANAILSPETLADQGARDGP